ncbi:MAG: penicillin acylase family protein [Thermoanaerobaculia bacterium]|nr:penicillin acylase family protein [Thermoanaerobaculia bacterium]
MPGAVDGRRLRMKGVLAGIAAAAAATVLLAGATLGVLVSRNLPDLSFPRIPGLRAKVTVAVDASGTVTVTADHAGDAYRAQGYLTARERLFQMELQRRLAGGELAEIFGRVALPSDRLHRIYGFARVAEAAVPLLPAAERAEVAALTDGINAFIDTHAGRWGLEFTLLRLTPRRYTPADALRVLLMMCEELSTTWRKEIAAERLLSRPPSVRRFLTSGFTTDDLVLVPDAGKPELPPLPNQGDATPLSALSAPGFSAADDPDEVPGSNGWAVSGALTKSGKPILANDPHLGLGAPGIWLPMRFVIGGHLVEGVTLPGLPGVTLGRNERIAWAFTNLYSDVQDLYRETIVDGMAKRGAEWEKVARREETIPVRGAAAERLVVRETSHGPLVTGNLALKWVALDPANLRLPASNVMQARDAEGVERALDGFFTPGQNVVWADAAGNIGWRATGLVPVRRPGTDGSIPYDGSDARNDWRGFVPQDEMPRLVNPREGFVSTANQRVAGTTWPHVLGTDWPSPARARRIATLLEAAGRAGRKLDRAAVESVQLDTASPVLAATMEAFAPFLPPDWGARFRGWDGRAEAASSRFLVARAFRRKVGERALRAWRVAPDFGLAEYRVLDLARADDAAFRGAGLGPKADFVKGAWDNALADLGAKNGKDASRWRWGEANRLAVRHPLGRVPGLSWLFDPPSFPQEGATGVVRVASAGFGQSMRFIVDWGAPDEATLVIPFGVSGHAGSPHRLDQLPFWRDGDPSGAATRLSRPARETAGFVP